MDKEIKNFFNQIYAEELLKQKTANFLQNKIQNQSIRKLRKFRMILAVTFIFAFIAGGGLYFIPSSYIDIDVNPSFGLTLNNFDRVIAVNHYNDEGDYILDMVNIRNLYYKEAVKKLINMSEEHGYLKNDGLLSLTVQAKETKTSLLNELKTTVDSALQTYNADVTADIFLVSKEIRGFATEHHVSPAKYLAIMELKNVDPIASIDSCAKHSISEIRHLTEEHNHRNASDAEQKNLLDNLEDEKVYNNHHSGHH